MKFKERWKKSTKKRKMLLIAQIIIYVVVLLFSVMGLLGYMNIRVTNNISIPLMGIIMIFVGLEIYKSNKLISYFCFGVALFMFGVGSTNLYTYLMMGK